MGFPKAMILRTAPKRPKASRGPLGASDKGQGPDRGGARPGVSMAVWSTL